MAVDHSNGENNLSPCETAKTEVAEVGSNRKLFVPLKKRISLSWDNVNVFIKQKESFFTKKKKKTRQLLHNVSGNVEPGTLVAIMGASGAGKTTFMNVLTRRNLHSLDVDGQVLVNGRKVESGITRLSAYVQQDDLFVGTLTVTEHLWFQAKLRMDKNKTEEERQNRIDEVIFELGLDKSINTTIGIPGSRNGLSGGERKRLSFATEILTDPSLMFCDEPTSGLDSFMSMSVVSVLKEMAKDGRTIMFTIHQPSSDLFKIFDHLLLLAEGRTVYQGKASEALSFFERAGLHCPTNYNPADFFIKTLAIVPGNEQKCQERIADIHARYDRERKELENSDRRSESFTPELDFMEESLRKKSRYKASYLRQLTAILWRCWVNNIRDKTLNRSRFMECLMIGLLLGLVYFNQQLTEEGVTNVKGVIFVLLTSASARNMMTVLTVFTTELPLFLREHLNGMYTCHAYFLAKALLELPITAAQTLITSVICYWMIGFRPELVPFLNFVAIKILVSDVSAAFGYFLSAATPSLQFALVLTTPCMMPLIVVGGLMMDIRSLPVYLIWIKYISWYYYGYEAIMINQWHGITNITCADEFCYSTGELILHTMGFKEENFLPDIGGLFGLAVLFRVLAYIILLIKAGRKI